MILDFGDLAIAGFNLQRRNLLSIFLGLMPLKLLLQIFHPECLWLGILDSLLGLADSLKDQLALGLALEETFEFGDLLEGVFF